jgi:PAS domain S-box-containing protein
MLSLLCIVGTTGAACAAGAEFLTRHLVRHDAAVVGDLARILLTRSVPASYFLSCPRRGAAAVHEGTFAEVAASVDVVRIVVYDPFGCVLWSDDPALVDRRFETNEDLRLALGGDIQAHIIRPGKEEHQGTLRTFDRLEEIYIPIRFGDGPIVGALEIYRHPPAFFALLDRGSTFVWILGGGGGLLLYVALFGVVCQASRRQQKLERELTSHASALESRVADRTRALTTLYEASARLHTTNDLEGLWALIASGALEIAQAEWSGVGQFVDDALRTQATTAPRDASASSSACPRLLAADIGWRAHRTGSAVFIDERSNGQDSARDRAVLCVPMTSRHATLGVIQVSGKVGGLPFTDEDARSLMTFATQAATILENTRLFNETKSTKEYFEHLIESSADAIAAVDGRGRLTLVNQAGQQMFGYRPHELVHRDVRRFWARGREDFRDFLRRLSDRGRLQEYETELCHADGHVLAVSVSASLLRGPRGVVTGGLSVVRDVTELHRIHQQMIRTERLAAAGLLAAGVAHEVGNPLACISAVTQMLATGSEDPALRSGLGEIQAHVGRIERIVRDLTQVSRPHAPEMRVTSLNELVQDSVGLARHSAEVRRMRIDLVLDPGRLFIAAVPDQLVQVFLNLTLNAADAGGDLIVTTTADTDAARVCFADTGHGMSSEELRRLFDPFFSTKNGEDHMGLGLFVSHEIVRQHGGVILAESARGRGSTFTVVLPLRPGSA